MRNAPSHAAGDARSPAVELSSIWHVDADDSYDVRRSVPGPDRLVAARTLAGRGELHFAGRDEPIDVAGGTLIVFDLRRITRYRCLGGRWHFWWFEFASSSAMPCPLEVPVTVRARRAESQLFDQIFAALRRDDPVERTFAASGFATLLWRWLAAWPSRASEVPHVRTVGRVIDMMHERLESGWSVSEMARTVHLSERRFRQVFREATSQPPKRFFERLRLEKGQRLLELCIYTVGEVADRLGFSSPFHFSREFTKRFGVPPSRASRQRRSDRYTAGPARGPAH